MPSPISNEQYPPAITCVSVKSNEDLKILSVSNPDGAVTTESAEAAKLFLRT
jgi:hypothetical protein